MGLKGLHLFDHVAFLLPFFHILFDAQVHGFFVLYHLILAQNHQILCLKFIKVVEAVLHAKKFR